MAKVDEWYTELDHASAYQPSPEEYIRFLKQKVWEFFDNKINRGLIKFFGLAGKLEKILEELFGSRPV